MAHELSFTSTGKAEMAFIGSRDNIWHGLGEQLRSGASIEEWGQATNFANWKILRSKVRFATERPDESGGMDSAAWGEMASKHVLFRSDNKMPLGLVSDKYKIVQPMAVLEFFRDLVAKLGFELNTAGALFDGRKFWALARITEDVTIADLKDKVGGYLLIATSCDGSMATTIRYTTIRVVCNNTLSMSFNGAAEVTVTHRSEFNAQDVKEKLGLLTAQQAFAQQMDQFRRMADFRLTPGKLALTTAQLMTPKDIAKLARDEVNELLDSRVAKEILHLACGAAIGSELQGASNSMWGWLNAVTQFVDHEKRSASDSHRMDSAQFGDGAKMKDRALALAVASMGSPDDRLATLGLRV